MRYDTTTKSYDSSVRFSRGYKGGRKSTDVNSGRLTESFLRGCDLMGWDNLLRNYCTRCGMTPFWCECVPALPGEHKENNG